MQKEAGAEFIIVFAIWPGMTHLDFIGPHQVLGRLPKRQTRRRQSGGRRC